MCLKIKYGLWPACEWLRNYEVVCQTTCVFDSCFMKIQIVNLLCRPRCIFADHSAVKRLVYARLYACFSYNIYNGYSILIQHTPCGRLTKHLAQGECEFPAD